MDYITIKEASEMWGVTTRAITYHVVAGRIPGAVKKAASGLFQEKYKKTSIIFLTGKSAGKIIPQKCLGLVKK